MIRKLFGHLTSSQMTSTKIDIPYAPYSAHVNCPDTTSMENAVLKLVQIFGHSGFRN